MKKFSKILSVALLVALVLSLGIANAFAADPTYTIAIKNQATGYAYSAYQIFVGDLSADGKTLSNIEWGTGISDAGKAALYNKYGLTEAKDQTAAKVAEAIAADNAANPADDVATLLAKTTTNGLGTAIPMPYSESITVGSETFKGYAATGQAAGWYLVVNTQVPDGVDISYSDYIVQVLNNIAVAPKSDTTTTEKKVKDTNDTTGVTTTWQDSADHDIGDEIPFQLKATIANDYASYSTYYFAFHDEQSAGLTFNADSVKVYVDGTEITSGYVVKTSDFAEGDNCTFEIIFADLKTITTVKAGSIITAEYTSTLNENALIGSQGNKNEMYGEFSNNPNDNQHGKTTKDTVIVFTYKPVIDKFDGKTNNPLAGAGFTLYKEVKTGTDAMKGSAIKAALATQNSSIEATALKDDAYYETKLMTTLTGGTSFELKGIDDGTYVLVETTIPDGYNAFKSVEIEVSATHTDGATPALTELVVGDPFTATKDEGAITGVLDADIENNSGTQLPSTGGIGTTIFYVVGGVLVLAAIILLVTKKRMSE